MGHYIFPASLSDSDDFIEAFAPLSTSWRKTLYNES